MTPRLPWRVAAALFPTLLAALADDASAQSLRVAPTYPLSPGARAPAAYDLNRDGIADLAVANIDSDTISVVYGAAGGAAPTRVDYAVADSPNGIVVADFNGDGRPDLVVACPGAGAITLLLGSP